MITLRLKSFVYINRSNDQEFICISIWYYSDDLTFHLLRRIHIHCAACENKVFGKNTLHEKYPCLLLLNIFEIHLREKFLQAATTQFQEIHNLMYLGHKYIHICVYIVVDICLVNMMLSNNKCNRILIIL